MGDMTRDSLVNDLKGVLMDAAVKFTQANDADFDRHLEIAAQAMSQVRPLTRIGTLTLTADQPNYPAPTDLLRVKMPLWGVSERARRQPWARNWPGVLPSLSLIDNVGVRELWLAPSPSAAQIADLGANYRFYYFAAHQIGAQISDTTLQLGDRHLLLIRAAAQALQELAHNGVSKPVQLGSAGVGGMPKNGTPGDLAQALLELFEVMAA